MLDDTMPELPEGYAVRPARMEDTQELSDLLNQETVLYAGIPQFTADELTQDLSVESLALEQDTRVVLSPDGRIVGYVEAFAETPFVRNTTFGATLPSEAGRGIGTWLMHWALQRLGQRIDEAPTDARVRAIGHALANNKGAHALLEDFGFTHVRVFHEMRIDVQEPPALVPLPDGITLRTLGADEGEERLFRAIDEVFQEHYGYLKRPFDIAFARWKHRVLGHPLYTPDLLLIAEDGNEIAGFSVSWPETIAPQDEGWLFELGVRRPWRKRGLAHALLTHTFDVFHKRGAKTVALGVDSESTTGALRLYERAGMRAVRSQFAYEKVLREGEDYQPPDDEE